MAKKKKRKTKEKQTASYSVELKGIILILIAIIGCCPFGIAADVIKGFSAFLTGACRSLNRTWSMWRLYDGKKR